MSTRALNKLRGQLKLRPNTLMSFTHPSYEPPTYEDLRTLRELSGKTHGELAAIVGMDDTRNFMKWTAPTAAKNRAQIPYAVWRLLLIELGIVGPFSWGESLTHESA